MGHDGGDAPRANRVTHAVVLLGASGGGALLLSLLGVPAGVLVGAVLGSVLANRSPVGGGEPRPLPGMVRVVGLVMLGCAVGAKIDATTLSTMSRIAVPLLGSVLFLLLLDVLLAMLLIVRYRVDAVTAVFACAPGGLSGIAAPAQEWGAKMGVVLAIHTVRILVVVLAVVPLVVIVLGSKL